MRFDFSHSASLTLKPKLTLNSIFLANSATCGLAAFRTGVEHVFAVQKDKMDLFIRTIGIARARTKTGMANLVYNVRRFAHLDRCKHFRCVAARYAKLLENFMGFAKLAAIAIRSDS